MCKGNDLWAQKFEGGIHWQQIQQSHRYVVHVGMMVGTAWLFQRPIQNV